MSQAKSSSIIHFHRFVVHDLILTRLKYMQAVALVTGDEFLVPYNLTTDTVDVLDYIGSLNFNWDVRENDATFDDYYGVDLAYVIGPAGFCFNFNMINAGKLFHLNLYHYRSQL
jgi:hypothetical protein